MALQVRVLRDACCSQDDQLGPLEATYSFGAGATLADLVTAVIDSPFLQYSSSHTTLTGFIADTAFVKVFSRFHLPDQAPEFLAARDALLESTVTGKVVEFRFVSHMGRAP